jgi:hypothetical protein
VGERLGPEVERDLRVGGAAGQEEQQRLAVLGVQRLYVDPARGHSPPQLHQPGGCDAQAGPMTSCAAHPC